MVQNHDVDSITGDLRWEPILRNADQDMANRLFHELTGILPLHILEIDLSNMHSSPTGFTSMLRLQSSDELKRKGPRPGKRTSIAAYRGKTDEAEREPMKPLGLKENKRRFSAKLGSEKKIVACLFNLLWPPGLGSGNPMLAGAPKLTKSDLRKRSGDLGRSSGLFKPARLAWQSDNAGNKMAEYVSTMRKLCSEIPTFMKPLPTFFFSIARLFIAEHVMAVRANMERLGTQKVGAESDTSAESRIILIRKVITSYRKYRGSLVRSFTEASVVLDEDDMRRTYDKVEDITLTLLCEMALAASPVLVYDQEQYFTSLRSLECSGGRVRCTPHSGTRCLLGNADGFEFQNKERQFNKGLPKPEGGKTCRSVLGQISFGMKELLPDQEKSIRNSSRDDLLPRLNSLLQESCAQLHAFSILSVANAVPTNISKDPSKAHDHTYGFHTTQLLVMQFWRCVFESVQGTVNHAFSFSEESAEDFLRCCMELVAGVSAFGNVLLRPKSAQEHIKAFMNLDIELSKQADKNKEVTKRRVRQKTKTVEDESEGSNQFVRAGASHRTKRNPLKEPEGSSRSKIRRTGSYASDSDQSSSSSYSEENDYVHDIAGFRSSIT